MHRAPYYLGPPSRQATVAVAPSPTLLYIGPSSRQVAVAVAPSPTLYMGPPSRHAAVAVAPSPTLLNVWVREIYHIFPSLKIAYLQSTDQLVANTRFSQFWWKRRNVAPCRCMHLIDYQRVAAFSRGWGLSPSYCHVGDSLSPSRKER